MTHHWLLLDDEILLIDDETPPVKHLLTTTFDHPLVAPYTLKINIDAASMSMLSKDQAAQLITSIQEDSECLDPPTHF